MHDPWFNLRQFTQARIAQGRAGCALPTQALLDFQLAHAAARDAVHEPWQIELCQTALQDLGMEVLTLATPIESRVHYLQRPDKGRTLNENSCTLLTSYPTNTCDIVIIMSNGLSSAAVHQHGVALLRAIVAEFAQDTLQLAPICLVPNARVALADEIGALLHAKLSIIIVGERPGLSAVDSLGIYLTYAPQIGNSDADRNCISNIRPPHGMSYQVAAEKLFYLAQEAFRRSISGVALKDEMPRLQFEQHNFPPNI